MDLLLGLDICIDCDFEKKFLDNGLIQDEWKMIKKDTGESHAFPVDDPIRTLKDAQDYVPPNPLKPKPQNYLAMLDTLKKYGKY